MSRDPLEQVIVGLDSADALRVVAFVLREHASDHEIRDSLADDALEFYARLAPDDPGAERIVCCIENATGVVRG